MPWLLDNCQQKTVEESGNCALAGDFSLVVPDGCVPLCTLLWGMQEGDTHCTDSWSIAERRSLYVDVRVWDPQWPWRLSMCIETVVSHDDVRRRSACDRQTDRRSRVVTGTPEDGYSYEGWKWGSLSQPHCWKGRHWPALAGSLSFRCLQMIGAHHFVERNWHPWSAHSKPQGRVRLSWKTKH